MKRWHWLLIVWTAPSVLFLAITAIVYRGYRIDPPDRLTESERAAVLAPLRAVIEGRAPTPCTVHRVPGPVAVTVWLDGRPIARAEGYGSDVGTSVDAAAKLLAKADPRVRIQVDVIVGRSVLGDAHWLGQYSLPFVTGMMADRDKIAIVRAVLSLAAALGMATVAEGIESSAVAQTLSALGCTYGQGYHFSRPLPAEQAYELLVASSS